jgi:hypothetical protein
VWPIDGEWWGVLYIDPAFTDRADEIIESLEPVATVAPPTSDPIVPATTTILGPTTPPLPDTKPADAPTYTLDDPAFSVEMTNGITTVGGDDPRLRSAVWTVDQTALGQEPAYLFANAFDWGGMPYDADGTNYIDVSRNGVTAVLDMGVDSSGDSTLAKKVYLPQADGVVWVFQAVNLATDGADPNSRLVDLAFAVVGNGAFPNEATAPTPDGGFDPVGDGQPAAVEYSDTYVTGTAGPVTVAVSDGATVWELRDATSITTITVLDRPALFARFAGGSAVITWQAAEGSRWWASLRFPDAATAALADQVIAALQPA